MGSVLSQAHLCRMTTISKPEKLLFRVFKNLYAVTDDQGWMRGIDVASDPSCPASLSGVRGDAGGWAPLT